LPGRGKTRRRWILLGRDRKLFQSTVPGKFGGHRRTKIYGRLDCRSALRAIAHGGYVDHRVFFRDAATARAAGFRPCAVCMPEQYVRWKSVGRDSTD
jgi:methylphosphotriester-DNA--protein-cysteine methyltransferase